MPENNKSHIFCSFCGRSQDDVGRLIAGNGVYICDQCIELCMSILDDGDGTHEHMDALDGEEAINFASLLKPRDIKAMLDEYVIGQEEAKNALRVAVYNH